jgi:hypothetical protein
LFAREGTVTTDSTAGFSEEVGSIALLADGRIYVFDHRGRVSELNDIADAVALLTQQAAEYAHPASGEFDAKRRPRVPFAHSLDEDLSVVVHQATGMISAQFGCGMIEALARLRIVAASTDQCAEDVACEVISGLRRFYRD